MQPNANSSSFGLRLASVTDAAVIALHRASMFQAMGAITSATAAALQDMIMRRRGLARMLLQHVMTFARAEGVESLVLHASRDGRPLHEQLGFAATNEMRLAPT